MRAGSGTCPELGQGGSEKGVQVESSTLNRKVVKGKELSARKHLFDGAAFEVVRKRILKMDLGTSCTFYH